MRKILAWSYVDAVELLGYIGSRCVLKAEPQDLLIRCALRKRTVMDDFDISN